MPSAWSATYTLSTPVPGTGHSQNESVRRASATQTLSVPDVLDRPRDKTRGAEVSHSALQFLFAEMVIYAQGRVSGISEFEQLLGSMGRQGGTSGLGHENTASAVGVESKAATARDAPFENAVMGAFDTMEGRVRCTGR